MRDKQAGHGDNGTGEECLLLLQEIDNPLEKTVGKQEYESDG